MKLREAQKHVLDEATGQWVWTKAYWINDKEVTEAEYNAAWEAIKAKRARLGNDDITVGSDVGTLNRPGCWPLESRAMGVHPDDVRAGNEYLAANGLKSQYNEKGRLVIPDNAERKKALKLKGMVDFDSFS